MMFSERFRLKYPVPSQFCMYAFVGFLSTSVDISFYFLLTRLLLEDVPFLTLKSASFLLGSVASFMLNRRLTFNETGSVSLRQVSRFYATVLTSLAVNMLVFGFLHYALSVHDVIAALLAVCSSFLAGFFLSRTWVFKPIRSV